VTRAASAALATTAATQASSEATISAAAKT